MSSTLDRIQAEMNARRFPEAEALCRQALKQSSRNVGVMHLLAICCAHTGRVDEAIQVARRAAMIRPGDAAIESNLGALYCMKGDYAGGLTYHRRAVQLAPKSALYHNNLSGALR